MTGQTQVSATPDSPLDVIIVGAGVGGLYSIYKLRELGFKVHALEQASGVGGTWFYNRYPGCRCDVESYQYSYSFSEELQREWTWTERFAPQPEILAYLNHVADRFNLRKDITFNTTVLSAVWNEDQRLWTVNCADGTKWTAHYCLMATGPLSVPRTSVLPKQEQFKGEVYYTGTWPEGGVDVKGKRVAVVGTSASGTQCVPILAAEADHLTVFQRTPNFSVPSRNAPMDPKVDADWKANYTDLRKKQWNTRSAIIFQDPVQPALETSDEELERIFEERWASGGLGFMRAFTDLFTDQRANDLAADFVRRKIAETVKDPELAKKLLPWGHPIGARRLCTDPGFYDAFNRDNVDLVDVKADPIVEVYDKGIRTESGATYEFDVLVLATGFQAMMGALTKMDIVGTGGRLLRDQWANGPEAHLGLAITGFPNLFYQVGPLSTGSLASMIQGNEVQTDWLADLLVHARKQHIDRIESTPEKDHAWMEECERAASAFVHYTAKESSYIMIGADGSRRFLVYMGGFDTYQKKLKECVDHGYEGFVLQHERETEKA